MDKYFKRIDQLREKVIQNKKISLNEACWILYAEMNILSDKWEAFRKWVINKRLSKQMIWPIWKDTFLLYEKNCNDKRYKNKIQF